MIRRTHTADTGFSEVLYSDCEAYRYSLTRTWRPQGQRLAYVMLNPSKADERQNDPTVERCERRARKLGFGAFRVVNLFSWRETDPARLRGAAAPLGPGNDAAILEAADWAHMILAAWGVHGAHLARGPAVESALRGAGYQLHNLGITKDGHPRHPLYLPYSAAPVLWHSTGD